jgi:hypothetical protein
MVSSLIPNLFHNEVCRALYEAMFSGMLQDYSSAAASPNVAVAWPLTQALQTNVLIALTILPWYTFAAVSLIF